MSILYIIVPLAIIISLGFLVAFLLAARNGQFDDLDSPSHRILFDDYKHKSELKEKSDE